MTKKMSYNLLILTIKGGDSDEEKVGEPSLAVVEIKMGESLDAPVPAPGSSNRSAPSVP
jgi:hypothetical protein